MEPLVTEPLEPSMAAQGPAVTDMPGTGAVDRGAPGADDDSAEPSVQQGHIVLVGYGQVGRIVAAGIKEDGGGLVLIEDSDHDVAAARAAGFEVVFGNAAQAEVLKLANLPAARALLVAISNGFEAGSVCESGRRLNPDISIIARAYSEEEESFLRGLGASTVIRGEQEIGRGILAFLRAEAGPRLPVAENILAQVARSEAPVVVALEPMAVAEPADIAMVDAPLVTVEAAAPVEADPAEEMAVPPASLEVVTEATAEVSGSAADADVADVPDAADADGDDIPAVLRDRAGPVVPEAEAEPMAEAEPAAAAEAAAEADGDRDGNAESEAVEVVVPPVEPEPRERGGKGKR
jgi:Kef-type K+ transport systems, predicted NAD-binding component